MNSIKQIIENQKKYKKNILIWFTNSLREAKKELIEIKSKDDFIKNEVNKLKLKFKKTVYKKEIDRLFFMNSKRNEKFYAWWSEDSQEVFILHYDKK